ncbi:TPA: hypothetical protein I7707_20105 [Vibrio vulnificus]|nr:hypothetical protein OA19_20115 [Vibrio vulnificus]KHF82862.1 hypothetical protein OA16_20790 [Vibrio vulnificus]HAS8291009.1 hypothetical protein [Vibrio vulnificus]HAS8335559.1 hypothetical protein [Vibrio vulnificus]
MSYFINNLEDSEPILQGDVFKIGEMCRDVFSEDEDFVMVITADCDIANNKMGHSFTLLPIVTAEKFLENYWLPDQFKNELEKLVKNNVEKINSLSEFKKEGYTPLTAERLREWLKDNSLAKMYEALGKRPSKDITLDSEKLEILKNEPKLRNFLKLRIDVEKKSDDKARKELSNAVRNSREEFLFIPDLSCTDEMGMVLKLRDVRAINKNKVFQSKFDAKLSKNGLENGILRVGRFSDYLRYSITQKFAMLFSRIGMPDSFENDEKESLDLLSTTILDKHNGK